ncbi:MAG: DUF4332 domain-containing protein [Gemmatimonadaceae bacterium]|nr:DUF4332 domain-containing protein [Gemmatimonadaceae bacterium]
MTNTLEQISGIGPNYARLLEASGIEDVATLSQRKPENLVNLMDRVNREQHLIRAIPPEKTVARWVQRARELTGNAAPAAAPLPTEPSPTPAFTAMNTTMATRNEPSPWLARPVHSS